MNLLRPLLLWLAGKPAIGNAIERAPYAGRLVNRFIAGSNAQAAVAAACSLVDRGYSVTFSYLGEDVATEAETASAVAEYETLIHLVAAAAIGEQTKVAIKPSLIGLQLDAGLAERNLERVVAAAEATGARVELDIERSNAVDPTLALYRAVGQRHESLGMALQAYLHRTPNDLRTLLDDRNARVRLVKGAYAEPKAIAHQSRKSVFQAYQRLLRAAFAPESLARGSFIAVATHDEPLLASARSLAFRRHIEADRWEVQLLYGMRPLLQERLLHEQYPVRIYLPYGQRWYPYFMRRLAERPANIWFALRQFLP